MKPIYPMIALALLLAACKEEVAELPAPVAITEESAGYYCQMNLLEHEGPKGQVHLEGMPMPIFFAQVRDVVAYLNMPEQSHAITVAYVQDMTGATWAEPGDWIEVSVGSYVVGADVAGGMGAEEIVPFSDPESAAAFASEHGGVVKVFAELGAEDALTPDAPLTAENDSHDENDMAARLKALAGEEKL